MQKGKWKEYFTFSKKERNAVILLIAITVSVIILPFFVQSKNEVPLIDEKAQQQLLSLQQYKDTLKPYYYSQQHSNTSDARVYDISATGELFYFDPNTLQPADWKRLGVRDKTIQTIFNYRNKGGHFRKPDDIRKIYGLRQEEADRLVPYVRIGAYPEKKDYSVYNAYKKDESFYEKKNRYKTIDINTATAEDWKAFPGIGDVLGNRIVKFRTSIGGFNSIEQVKKTYGLPDSTYQFIRPYLKITDSSISE